MSDTPPPPPNSPLTAFPGSEIYLKEVLAEADYDPLPFETKFSRCQNCHGMCCYHGAHLNDEEAAFVQAVADQEREYFATKGIDLPQTVVIDSVWRGEPCGKKTALKNWDYRERLSDFPEHWDNTACVFLNREGLCGLQMYSNDCGKHKWFAKPFTCWLHPIGFPETGGLTVYDSARDPTCFDNYPGFTTVTLCGRPDACGQPAYETLREELEFLGTIVGRDFYNEIKKTFV